MVKCADCGFLAVWHRGNMQWLEAACVVRTTNLLERLFLEERRRTKIITHAHAQRVALVVPRATPSVVQKLRK